DELLAQLLAHATVDLDGLQDQRRLSALRLAGAELRPQLLEPVLGPAHLADLLEVEAAHVAGLTSAPERGDAAFVVTPRSARAVPGGLEQPDLLVVADGPRRHTGQLRDLADPVPDPRG